MCPCWVDKFRQVIKFCLHLRASLKIWISFAQPLATNTNRNPSNCPSSGHSVQIKIEQTDHFSVMNDSVNAWPTFHSGLSITLEAFRLILQRNSAGSESEVSSQSPSDHYGAKLNAFKYDWTPFIRSSIHLILVTLCTLLSHSQNKLDGSLEISDFHKWLVFDKIK